MSHSLIKNCLRKDFFIENQSKLKPELFDEHLQEIFNVIVGCHNKTEADLTSLEVFTYWQSINPTSTPSWSEDIKHHIELITDAEEISLDISKEVIEEKWRQSVGLDIAEFGLRMRDGDMSAMDQVIAYIDKVSNGYLPDDIFGEEVTNDIYKLIEFGSDEHKLKFNIKPLSDKVYGLARGDFCVIAAYANVGKTAFAVSICAARGGFCEQGYTVAYVANEEIAKKTKLRAVQAYAGMTKEEVFAEPEKALRAYSEIEDKFIIRDCQDWTIQTLDAYLSKYPVDCCIVDMADKINLTQKFNSGHERLRFLYYRLRELAKKHSIVLIAMSQASHEAEGQLFLSMSMLEGSKVGKCAESDLMLGIGAKNLEKFPDDPFRQINVMKNKITGWHGAVPCNLQIDLNRYVA